MQKINDICDKIIRIGFSLLALLVPLLLTKWNYELFEYNKMMAVYGITAIITLAWVGKIIAQKRISVARTPFTVPIVLFVLSQLVSALFSMDPHVSWFGYYSRFNGGMFSVFCYALLFFAFVSNITKAFIPKLTRFLLGTASVVAIYGVLEHFGIDKGIWVQDVQARVFSTLGQPNWLAAYLTAMIPITFSIAYIKKTTWTIAFVPGAITVLFFLTLLYTGSRSGLIAALIVDVLFWFILFFQTKQKRALRSPFALAHIAFILCVFFTGTHVPQLDHWITFDGWKQQLTHAKSPVVTQNVVASTGPVLETGGTESGVIRTYVWEAAINAWRATPKNMAIGTGTETFAFAFYQYKPIGHNMTSEWDFLYNKAHNEYLNYLATTGLFGLATYLVLLGVFTWWFIKTIIRKNDTSILILGVGLGWLSLLITNFFGFSVVVTQTLLFLLPAAAYIYQTKTIQVTNKTIKLGTLLQRLMLFCAFVLAIFSIVMLTISWIADKTFATGYRYERAGQFAQAYSPLTKSIMLNTTEPFYKDEYANTLVSLAVAAMDNQDATLAATLGKYAIDQNDAALTISPQNVNFWKSKTKIYYALSSLDETLLPESILALEHAKSLSPMDPKIVYNLAILEGKVGNSDKAISYLEDSIRLKPNYRDAYYALYVFYQDAKQPNKAIETIQKYLSTVNSQDEEFKKLIE